MPLRRADIHVRTNADGRAEIYNPDTGETVRMLNDGNAPRPVQPDDPPTTIQWGSWGQGPLTANTTYHYTVSSGAGMNYSQQAGIAADMQGNTRVPPPRVISVEEASVFQGRFAAAMDRLAQRRQQSRVTPARLRGRRVETREEREDMASIIFSVEFENILYRNTYKNPVCAYLINNWSRLDTSRINYVDTDGGLLSFLPAGRPHAVYPDQTWSTAGRQTGKPGRVARMLIPKDDHGLFADRDFESFANIIKATDVNRAATFMLVTGNDIKYWYDGYRYSDGTGSLEMSCMRHTRCRDFFGIYIDNPDIVSMLILVNKDSDLLMGRALVWHIPGCETPIMDRVYGSDSVKQAFRHHAETHGWYSRAFQSFEHETMFVKQGELVYLDIRVKLPNYRYHLYPYLDTLKYFDWNTGCFANTPHYGAHAVLMDTRGAGAPWSWTAIPNEFPGESHVYEISEKQSRDLMRAERNRTPLYGHGQIAPIDPPDDDGDDDDDHDYAPLPLHWTDEQAVAWDDEPQTMAAEPNPW